MKKYEENLEQYFNEEIMILEHLKKDKNIVILLDHLLNARNNLRTIYIMGNGGSGAAASHWVNDFNKGMHGTPPFKMICLNDNIATLTAIANDDSYDNVFVKQLEFRVTNNDLVIGISGSGNSRNVIKAIDYANAVGAMTFAIVGFDGGKLKKEAKCAIHINTNEMGIFEDLSMTIDHAIFYLFKKGLLNG